MTCIVAIKHENKIYMGGDSLGSNSYSKTIRKDKKVFVKKDMIFGFTSSYRMGQILEYSFDPPEHKKKDNDFKYLVNDFVPALIEAYSDKSYLKTQSEQASGGTFLLGYRNNIYKIESDFQVGMPVDKFESCGCGEYFALGSLHSTQQFNLTPEERIKMAIKAASAYSVGVGGPIKIMSLGG